MRYLFCAAVVIGIVAAGVVDAAEPAAVRHQPTATCLTPVPAHVTLRSLEADVRAVLAAWEAAAARIEPVGKSERQRMEYLLRDAYSAHELALASEFRGPVRAGDLWRRYAWSRSGHAEGVTRLIAEPRETAEALFVPRFTIELGESTHVPTVIWFADRAGEGWKQPVALNLAIEPSLARAGRSAAVTAMRAGSTSFPVRSAGFEDRDGENALRPAVRLSDWRTQRPLPPLPLPPSAPSQPIR